MSRTLQDPEHLRQLLSRLDHLRPESARQWGTLSPHAMVCHILDSLRVALGEQTAQDRSTWFLRTVVKRAIITLRVPAPKGKVKTVPLNHSWIGSARRVGTNFGD